MKRTALLALWLTLGFIAGTSKAQVQAAYVGFGIAHDSVSALLGYPYPSLQVGGPLTATLEIRGTVESLLVVSDVGLEVLYPFASSPALRLYAGGGVNVPFFFFYPNGFGARGVFGGEYTLETAGLFAEVRLAWRLGGRRPFPQGRLGINFPL
jgi:hypothetical protein